MFND